MASCGLEMMQISLPHGEVEELHEFLLQLDVVTRLLGRQPVLPPALATRFQKALHDTHIRNLL
ncbi:hypothetical protein EV192_1288 [Actinocrispum wychmicini]|uniref:Uncharacterized protein n=2 Tax=Actinocrispum wychmicini TaxID=1213861 RepID=A0A4R2IM40_9PSEU|nr:hypothetical protein EV192_1288 [Actinocrispum wychmicini]